MSTSHLINTIVATLGDTRDDADDVDVARAIVTALSAAGYEIARTRAIDDELGRPRLTAVGGGEESRAG
ncbi:MAG TPA: hypothetical protein VF743_06455 [Acidimicrobiales bacterium]